MRGKLVRRMAVAGVAAVLTLPRAVPAEAAGGPPAATLPIGQIIAVVQQAYSLYRSLTQHSISMQEATSQMLAAINSARTEIIAHVDAVAAAEVRACAQSAIIDFADFEAFTPDNQQALARDATSCVTLAQSLLSVVSDKAAVNELGFAMDSVGPIALVARTRSGLSNGSLLSLLTTGNQALTTRLYPSCRQHYEARVFDHWRCVAFNGDSRIGLNPDDPTDAADGATSNTSRKVAQVVLPLLVA
jgi:hypothetical protein